MDGLKKLRYRLTGVSGLIMHNGQLADPRNKWAKAIKEISSKRNKTDADFEKMAELEFKGGFYLNEELVPAFPPDGTEAIIRAGAKKSKDGKKAQSGVFCFDFFPVQYDGPKTIQELWEYQDDEGEQPFAITAGVKVGQSRVMRTRPIFHEWTVDIEVHYNPEICNESQITQWLEVAGVQVGAFDWRPRYGRFTVELLDSEDKKAA